MKINKNKAFTLIELLVVIVIIGILAGIGIAGFKEYQNKAKVAVAEAALVQIQKAIVLAHTLEEEPLKDITGNGCSGCNCRRYVSYELSSCTQNWENALDRISEKSLIDLTEFKTDPWGFPFLLDENSGEFDENDCRLDLLGSAGPDGIVQTSFSDAGNTLGDDIIFAIPQYRKACL